MILLLLGVALSYMGAFCLRFEFALPSSVEVVFFLGLCIFIPVKGIVYWTFRLQASRWRLVGLFDLYRLVIANITASALACVVTAAVVGLSFPRSIYILDAALCFLAYGFLALERARGTAAALDDLDETDSPFAIRHPVSPPALVIAD